MMESESYFVVAMDLQQFLSTTFWFIASDESDKSKNIELDLSQLDPLLLKELIRWSDHITIGLETMMLSGDYKADISPYEGVFPIYLTEKTVVFSFDHRTDYGWQ